MPADPTSGLPLACDLRVGRRSLGFSPELHTSPSPATHVGVGTGMLDTGLGYVTINWSSDLRSRSLRATSCRTPVSSIVTAGAAPRWA